MVLNYIQRNPPEFCEPDPKYIWYARIAEMRKKAFLTDQYLDHGKIHMGTILLSEKEFTNFYRKCEEGECIEI